MRLRSTTIIAAFLIISISIPPSMFSQTARRQTRRSQRGDALTSAINELLRLNPLPPELPGEKDSEGNSSEDENKPPADDAPIKELTAYWSQNHDTKASKPSDKVRQRLLEACEDRPEFLIFLINHLPETADTHDRIYKLLSEVSENEFEILWKPYGRDFLRRNSSYFRDELISASLEAGDNANPANEDLRALARLDWNAARPILESLASARKTFVTSVALVLLYEHAAQERDSARTESYRALLKAIVENRQSSWRARAEALASLMSAEWSGQEDWFISLFADPTLGGFEEDGTEGPYTLKAREIVDVARDTGYHWEISSSVLATALNGNTVFPGNADRWLPVISSLVGHNQRVIHRAAVKCLVGFLINESSDESKKKDIARQLSPLLTDPDWAAKNDRGMFIGLLSGLNMPELAPELIWILDYDEVPEIRAAAAKAITKYRDPRAIPALRRALEKEKTEDNREEIITALAESGGFSDEEMAVAVEAYANLVVTDEGSSGLMASATVSP